jgi:hypothetical protein
MPGNNSRSTRRRCSWNRYCGSSSERSELALGRIEPFPASFRPFLDEDVARATTAETSRKSSIQEPT